MATMVVKHNVASYARWRPVYDDGEALRAQHGCTGARVMRDPSNESALFVLLEFPSVEAAQSFAGDPELASTMSESGVTGPPSIEFYVDA